MPKVALDNFNAVLQDLPIESVPLSEAEIFLTWQDVLNPKSIKNLQKQGKKVIVMQHGRSATVDYSERGSVLTADKILVWGKNDANRLDSVGITSYEIVGCPLFRHLLRREKHEGINIIFVPAHFNEEMVENMQVLRELRKTGHHITSKLIEGHAVQYYDNPVLTDRTKSSHIQICASILATADLVVGIEEGTFELLATAMGIPVIAVECMKPRVWQGVEVRQGLFSPAAYTCSLDKVVETVEYVLAHPNEREAERAQVAQDDGGYGLDTEALTLHAIEAITH